MEKPTIDDGEPLPLTIAFVLAMGSLIAIGWFLMFFLMKARWG